LRADIPSFFLGFGWARYKEINGWKTERFLARRSSRIVAITQLFVKSKFSFGLAWAPGGIALIDAHDTSVQMSEIFQSAREYLEKLLPNFLIRLSINQEAHHRDVLSDCFVAPLVRLNSSETLIIDCFNFAVSSCSKHARRKIKESLNLKIDWSDECTNSNLSSLSSLIRLTSRRNSTVLPFGALNELNKLISQLDRQQYIVLVGRHGSEEVSGCLVLLCGRTAFFCAAGSSDLARGNSTNYLLIIELIRRLKIAGIDTLDFGGLSENNKLPGLDRFKIGFGGTKFRKVGEREFSRLPVIRLLFNFLILLRASYRG